MTDIELLEGNKLIADFMDWIHHEDVQYDIYEMNNLKYHSSWDWLMPVVEKIEQSGWGCKMYLNGCQFPVVDQYARLWPIAEKRKIDAVWLAVVFFIRWYNTVAQPAKKT
jgi:hypothetical protein